MLEFQWVDTIDMLTSYNLHHCDLPGDLYFRSISRQIYILYQKFIYSHYHRKLYKTFSSQCTRKFYNLIVVPTSFEYYIRRDLFCL